MVSSQWVVAFWMLFQLADLSPYLILGLSIRKVKAGKFQF